MEEKIYKTMSSTGAANLAIGICVLVSHTPLDIMSACSIVMMAPYILLASCLVSQELTGVNRQANSSGLLGLHLWIEELTAVSFSV